MTRQRVPIPCPSCDRSLQIRLEHLGRWGTCQHCGHRFRADRDGSASRKAGGGTGPRGGGLAAGVPGIFFHLASQSAQSVAVCQEFQATAGRLPRVRPALDRDPASGAEDPQPGGGDVNPFTWDDARSVGSFADWLGPAVEFNPELDELEEQFEAERDTLAWELDRLRSQLQEAERARDAARAEHARERGRWEEERGWLVAEREAWKRETESLRARLEAAGSPALCFSCLSYPEG